MRWQQFKYQHKIHFQRNRRLEYHFPLVTGIHLLIKLAAWIWVFCSAACIYFDFFVQILLIIVCGMRLAWQLSEFWDFNFEFETRIDWFYIGNIQRIYYSEHGTEPGKHWTLKRECYDNFWTGAPAISQAWEMWIISDNGNSECARAGQSYITGEILNEIPWHSMWGCTGCCERAIDSRAFTVVQWAQSFHIVHGNAYMSKANLNIKLWPFSSLRYFLFL